MKLHLPKQLLKAVLLAASTFAAYTVSAADSISINFTHDGVGVTTETKGELGGIAASGWTNITAGNTSGATVNNQSGVAAGTITISNVANSWQSKVPTGDTLTSIVQNGYIDVPNHTARIYTIAVDHDYWLTDVTFYMSADTANKQYASLNVNGISYKGGATVTTGSGTWGTTGNPAGVTEYNTNNCFTVTGVTGDLVLKNDYPDGGNRATLAGLQVKDVSDTTGYFTTLGEGETSAASATWTINGASATYGDIADAQKNLGIRANEKGSTLVLTGGETVNSIAAVENTVTVKADSAINLSSGLIYIYEGAGMVLDASLTGTNNIVSGKGSITLNGSGTFKSITTADLTVGGNVEVSGAVNVAGSVALTQGGYVKVTGNFGNFSYQSLDIAEGATLQLKGGFDGARVLNFTGNGTIELDCGTDSTVVIPGRDNGGGVGDMGTVQNFNSTSFAGNISVKSGLLVLGNNSNWQGYWGLDLSSLKSIDLDGGSLKLFGAASTVTAINVNNASSMAIHQASVTEGTAAESTAGKAGYTIGTLNLNKNLNIQTTWRSVVEIGTLKGAGDLFMDTAGADRVLSLYINNIDATLGMDITFAANVNAYLGGKDDSVLSLGGVITNSGNLTLDGAVTILGDETKYTLVKPGSIEENLSHNDGLDGYQTTSGSSYLLIDNNGGTVDLKTTEAVFGTGTTTLTKTDEGDVTFVGGTSMDTVYHVNTQDITIGGSSSSADTGRATAAIVATGRTVTIAGASDAATAEELLVNSTGEGNITLSTNVQLGENDVTKVKGKLTIGEGVQLNLGNGDFNNNKEKQEASLSSFNSIVLDGGHIRVQNRKDTWKNVTVTDKGATLHINDLANSETDILTFAQTTTLNGHLTMTNDWGERIVIEKLRGTGSLIIDDDGRSDVVSLTISSTENYSGKIHVKQTHNNLKLNVAEDAGLHVHFEGTSGEHLQLENIAAGNSVTLQGVTGHLGNGTTIAADIEILNVGTVKAGIELNDGYFAVNTFTGNISGAGNLVINKDNLKNHGLTFTGDVSEWTGRMDVAKGTHTITYTGDASEVKNVEIEARNGATANIVFDHDKAATVSSEIMNSSSTLNLVVKNTAAEGTTFSGSVQATTATIKAGTVAKFTNASVQMTNLLVETGAQLTFTAKDALNVSNLEVANVGTITVANGDAAGRLSASGAVTLAGGATINAAVVDLSGASSVSFDVASGAIALNGALTMRSTEAFVAALGDSLAGLTAGDILAVFTGVSSFTVGDVTYSAESENQLAGVDLSTWSSDVAVGQYTMTYDTSANVGSIVITVGEVIPEPASATLSLAALMMLCARRRRRK